MIKDLLRKSKCALVIFSLLLFSNPVYSEGSGVSEDGVATDTYQAHFKGEKPDGYLEIITMMFYGFATSRAMMVCKPIPVDVAIAAAGGITYTVGEIYAWDAFKKIKEDKFIEFEVREDLQNDAQLAMLKELKSEYDEIAKTAKNKMMIQQAAAVAYTTAAAWALTTGIRWELASKGCSVCSYTMKTASYAIGNFGQQIFLGSKKWTETHDITVPQIQAMCKTAIAESTAAASNIATASVCGPIVKTCMLNETMCNTVTSICTNLNASIITDSNEVNSFSKFANSGIKIPELNESFVEETLVEDRVLDIKKDLSLISFIDENSPFYNLELSIEGSNLDEQTNSYIMNRDRLRFYSGEKTSTSITQDEFLRDQLKSYANSSRENDFSRGFSLALKHGVDLLIPSVHAGSFGNVISGLGAVGLALFESTASWIDGYISTPFKRSTLWAAGGVLAGVAFNKTKQIMNKAKENADKIQRIIDKMERMNGVTVDSAGEYMNIPALSPHPNTGNDPIFISDTKTPCADSNKTSRCKSAQKIVRGGMITSSIPKVFVGTATDAAQVADGLVGTKAASGKTVDGLVRLSRKNTAVRNELRKMQKRYNRERSKVGKSPLSFDKMTKAMASKMSKRVGDQIRRNGADSFGLLTKLGSMPKLGTKHTGDSSESSEYNGKYLPDNSKNSGAAFSGHSGTRKGGFITGLEKDRAGFLTQRESGHRGSNSRGGSYSSGSQGSSTNKNTNDKERSKVDKEVKDEEFKDIVRNKDVSIFTVISVRYLRSAFPSLLDEVKRPASK
jgi:hypothetical protein